ncbi:DUF58 domain-containing protein [Streptacidiphilus pinicola]|uniref:DUF58 domain-containing protein n=1 Tax=Streptacidiphilus pinicola TaxID=2219663 RepID=A0A2X0IDG1_9ACTN|nr:DUF58 domain-containing protein [Streptacidiphilus pinicola]RAG81451.1 DUF58 domain-containing protein [Streptacidiphilus pinicola]
MPPSAAPSRERREPGTVRLALHGLTTRGRCFLAAGLTAVFCAYLLGQFALLQVGLLLTALPLGSVAMLVRTRYRVASGRSLAPARTPAGQEARVSLRVDNVSRVRTGLLMLEDRVPYVLGPRPRFVLDRIEPRGYREVSYRVRSDLRGRYPLGPLQLRLGDPFGLCELTRSFTAADLLTVVPQVQALPSVKVLGEWSGFGDSQARAVALAGEDDVVPREYRHGDDLRRVHWRSTAKYGELMVRREEQPLRHHATVLLDTRDRGHRGAGPASSFEWAVSAAASVALHLLDRGYEVRLLTDTGEQTTASGSPASAGAGTVGGGEAAGLMLDRLAVVDLSDGRGLSRAEDVLRLGGEGLLVAILGALDDEQLAELSRLRRRTGSAVALLLDTESWTLLRGLGGGTDTGNGGTAEGTDGEHADAGPEQDVGRERHERLLRQAGWRVLPASSGDSLPELWRLLARGGAGSGPRAATAAAPASPSATTSTTTSATTDGGS